MAKPVGRIAPSNAPSWPVAQSFWLDGAENDSASGSERVDAPDGSTAVTTTLYVPAALHVCETVAPRTVPVVGSTERKPVDGSRSVVPSPQS